MFFWKGIGSSLETEFLSADWGCSREYETRHSVGRIETRHVYCADRPAHAKMEAGGNEQCIMIQ